MTTPIVGCLSGVGLLLLGCGAASGAAAEPVPTPPTVVEAPRPPVVVAIVIDQLPAWLAVERWPTLPRDGGFARLLGESSNAGVLRYPYAHNATAMGHSSLFTGAAPHESGIVANGKLLETGSYVSYLQDPSTRVVGGTGPADRPGASLAPLEVPTVADALLGALPDATVISVSMKDRGAVFGGGRSPSAVLWFDARTDAFVTSTAFAERTPTWAAAFTAPAAGAPWRDKVWWPLDPRWLEAQSLPPGDLGQGDFHKLGRAFPHDVNKADPAPRAFVATPFADNMLLGLAAAAAAQIAAERRPSLLVVSLSATDYIGHVFGPDAPEAWDQMLRLDRELGRFFDHLDQTLGSDGYAVVLTSDHGVPPTPEVMKARFCGVSTPDPYDRRCKATPVRLLESQLARVAEAAADRAAGEGTWVLGGNEPYVELTRAARDLPSERRAALLDAVLRALDDLPGVQAAYAVERSPEACPALPDESVDALVCRSLKKGKSGDVFVLLERGSFIDTNYVEGHGVNHGSHWLFDRTVPIIVRPPRAKGAATRRPRIDPNLVVDHRAYASTIAALLGIEPPPAAKGGAVLTSPRQATGD